MERAASMASEAGKTTTYRADPGSGSKGAKSFRGEVDTSAPIESVKEAVIKLGGIGFWKPIYSNIAGVASDPQHHHREEFDSGNIAEQAMVLQKELIMKERETLDVLKELESTKRLVEELKSKLQKEESEANFILMTTACDQRSTEKEKEEKENQVSQLGVQQQSFKEGFIPNPSSSPALILWELKQAKLNITRTTNDLADVQASVESLNKKLDKERISLEKTRERLAQNSLKISSLEKELKQTKLRLQVEKDTEIKSASGDPLDITRELHRLSSEAEHFKKMEEAAKSEALRTMSEIEQTKSMLTTAEIRLVAARKMKEAARAAEAAAIAELNVISDHESSGNFMRKHDGVTLSLEEYIALTNKAQDAEEQSKKRVADAMHEVDEANLSKVDILKRVEEATEQVRTSKKVLEEALERVDAANRDKLTVEEALRKWQSEGYRRRSSIHFSTKFKNSYPSHHRSRRDSLLLDVNGLNLINNEAEPVLKPTLSIGQILSKKLFLPLEFEAELPGERSSVKRKVSLGQLLGKQSPKQSFDRQRVEKENGQRQFSTKRKKFGFVRFSLLLSKQQKKKKKPVLDLRR